MGSVWNGENLKISIFGESHGSAIGVVIDNFPEGFFVDLDYIEGQLIRRRPDNSNSSTKRKEEDMPEIVSGIFKGFTTGAPICAIIRNKDTKSEDYEKISDLIRPGHADYTAYIKYRGYNDNRGGGHFSGRMTAPLVFAGALCAQYIMEKYKVHIYTKINSIAGIKDDVIGDKDIFKILPDICKGKFPLYSDEVKDKIIKIIDKVSSEGDSVGGILETYVRGMPAGKGNPFFSSLESEISKMIFSVPSVKGISFGAGFDFDRLTGKNAKDEFYLSDGNISTYTNNNGGINGGISNGMPIVFSTVVKPTSSISAEQRTVNIDKMRDEVLLIEGRHDSCIVPRIIPVIDNSIAIVLMDQLL